MPRSACENATSGCEGGIWLHAGICGLGKEVFSWDYYSYFEERLWEHTVTAEGSFRVYMLVYYDE